MITTNLLGKNHKADSKGDCSLGNALFRIASVIGIAIKNGYDYGFPDWLQQEFFINPLPKLPVMDLNKHRMTPTYKNFDFGFRGFNIPDNIEIQGELASYKYFEHCEPLIRHYLTLKKQCEPLKDCILMHYRAYESQGHKGWVNLGHDYYAEALSHFPKKRVIVITDNIEAAQESIRLDCEYTSNSPIVDLYLLSKAKYLVMGNSTFSWWGAWLSGAETVAPLRWFEDKAAPMTDFYLTKWILI